MSKVTTLPNGLRVVSKAMPHVETVAVALHVDAGARHEGAHVNGVAHLFEHMVFKGTATRSARVIAEVVEDVGGSLNAYTARDITVFHARLLKADLALGVEVIADLVTNPVFDADETEREKQVVLQELGEARDTPDDIVFDHLQEAAFPEQALGRSILGSDASIASLDGAALREWLVTQYRAGSCVLVAAGALEHDVLVDLAERWLGGLSSGTRPATIHAAFGGGAHHDKRKFEQAHLTLGLAAPAHHDPAHDAALLFAGAAGGGASSRLFQELREERGLAYSVYASTTPYADTGLFSVYLATARKDAAKALALTETVLAATATGLEPAELERARAQVRAGLLMALEAPGGWSEFLARSLLVHGRVVPPAEVVARFDAVTLDEVRAAGAAMLRGPRARADVGAPLLKAA